MNHRKPLTITTASAFTFEATTWGPDDGEPILLLHGWPQNSRSWDRVAPLLAERGRRVVAVDQRGYSPGARPEGVEHYTTDQLAHDVIEIADALGWQTFDLVGHDWGASVAWVVAAHHGDRLRTLTAVSVPHLAAYGAAMATDADQQERGAYIGLLRQPGKAEEVLLENGGQRLAAMYQGVVPEVDDYVAFFTQPGVLTASLNWYRAMGRELAELPPVNVPTTFVWGNDDLAIGRAGAEACGNFVTADYRFVELDAGHWIPDTHAAELAAVI